jgi:heat shock protein HslJ
VNRATSALLAAVALSACATPAPEDISVACARGRPGPIEGDWRLDRIDGVPWRASVATLLAEPEGFAGTLACNGFGTSEPDGGGVHYAVERGRLRIKGDLVTTTAGCFPPRATAFEAAFLAILDAEPRVSRREDFLCLYTDEGFSLEFLETESAS